MMVRFHDATLQQFLEAEVNAGRYASVDAAIEAAVSRMKWENEHLEPLDADLEERLHRAEEQISRGEIMTVAELRDKIRRRLGIKL